MRKSWNLSLILLFVSIVVAISIFSYGSFDRACAQQVTIRLQDYLLNEEDMATAMKSIITEFEAKFPNIRIKMEGALSLADAIKNMEGANPPDVARIETPYLPYLAEKKLITDLDIYVKKIGGVEYYWIPQFAEHAIIPTQYKKKICGVPQEGSSILLYINKDLFKKAGLNTEDLPQNWNQFLSCAQKLTQPNKNQWGFGGDFVTLPYAPTYLEAWFRAHNADFFDNKGKKVLMDTKEGIEAFSFLVQLHTKHKIMPPQIEKWTYKDTAILFAKENLAMLQGDFAISRIIYEQNPGMRKKAQAIFFPGETNFAGRSSSLCMSKKSKYPDQAWSFISYMTSRPSLLTLFKKAQKFPSSRLLYRGTVVEIDKDGGVFGKASEFTSSSLIPSAWPEISALLLETLKEAFTGRKSPEQAIKDAAKKTKKLM